MKNNNLNNIIKYTIFSLLLLYIILKYIINTNYLQQNTVMYWILLITSFLITINVLKTKYNRKLNIGIKILIFVGIYYLLFIIVEFMDIFLGVSLWNQTERTSNCYDWFEQYLSQNYDEDFKMDLSEGYFDGDYKLSIKDATIKKYDYIFDNLQLKPGMKLLDMGCGSGTWMLYCKNKGVKTVGLTLSKEQARVSREKGLEVYVQDYRLENSNFINEFDRITLPGSTEHNCSFTGIYNLFGYNENIEKCNNIRTNLFKLCKKYLKEDNAKIHIAGLVINDDYKFSNYDLLQGYIMERHYGGRYSRFSDYKKCLTDANFKILNIIDTTADYHYTPVVDEDYFGCWKVKWNENTLNKITYFIKGVLSDPYLLHHWLYYSLDTWQWQFGSSCSHKKPLTNEEVNNAPCQNKWFLCSV